MTLADVTGESCRRYVKHRANAGGARRDLEDLRAAINHHAKEGLHRESVRVALPDKGAPRDLWLGRQEVARLLWACWRTRELQTVHRGLNKGTKIETSRYPLRHIGRFVLIALYTGTRAGAVMTASLQRGPDKSFVDLDRGMFYRLAEGKRATNKRQTPGSAAPAAAGAHAALAAPQHRHGPLCRVERKARHFHQGRVQTSSRFGRHIR
jgi:hypothetical protein